MATPAGLLNAPEPSPLGPTSRTTSPVGSKTRRCLEERYVTRTLPSCATATKRGDLNALDQGTSPTGDGVGTTAAGSRLWLVWTQAAASMRQNPTTRRQSAVWIRD